MNGPDATLGVRGYIINELGVETMDYYTLELTNMHGRDKCVVKLGDVKVRISLSMLDAAVRALAVAGAK